eukprot:150831_1
MATSRTQFIWSVPSRSDNEMDMLCKGYIRNQSILYIPMEIIDLCILFYKHNSKSISNQYKSSIFEHKDIKFYMSFERAKYKDTLPKRSEWNINIPFYPQHMHKIEIHCQTIVKCTNTHKGNDCITEHDTTDIYPFERPDPNNKEEQSPLKITSRFPTSDVRDAMFSFHVLFHDIKCYDHNHKLITEPEPCKTNNTIHYLPDTFYSHGGHVWFIKDKHTLHQLKQAQPGTYFVSSVFKVHHFKWQMKLSYYDDPSYGSAVDFCLYLCSLSQRITQIHIRYKVWITNMNHVSVDECYTFKANARSLWKLDLFHVNTIKDLKEIRLNIEIQILDVFYRHKEDKENYIAPMHTALNTLHGKFVWNITDIDEVQRIKSAQTADDFCSEIHTLGPFKWYLKFYPNGYSSSYTGCTDLFLRLASLPPNISHISVAYHLILVQKNARHFTISQFSSRSSSFGWNKLKNADIADVKEFTFIAQVNVIEVFDSDGNVVTDEYMIDHGDDARVEDMQLAKTIGGISSHIWKIEGNELDDVKNALNGVKFESNLFELCGLLWVIQVYPNGDTMDDMGNGDTLIQLASLSPQLTKLCIYYKVSLLELGVSKNSTIGLTHSRMKCWTENMWKLADIMGLESVTFELEIGILDVFYAEKSDAMTMPKMNINEINNRKTYRKSFEWKALGVKQVKEWKECVSLKSEYYRLYGAALFMQFNPNHECKEDKEDTSCSFGFTLCSIPPSVHSLSLQFTLSLAETKTQYVNLDQFSNEYNIVNWNVAPLLYKSVICDLPSLTFGVVIDIVAVYDKQGRDITAEFVSKTNDSNNAAIEIHKMKYEWCIDAVDRITEIRNAANGKHFMSGIFTSFKLKWFLQFIPNPTAPSKEDDDQKDKDGTSLFICLASMAPNIGYISMHYELRLAETNSFHRYCTQLTNTIGDMAVSWRTSTLKRSQILDLDTLCFSVVIAILDVYDQNGANMTHQFVDESTAKMTIAKPIGFACGGDYTWRVDGVDRLKMVCDAENGAFVMSDVFEMHGFKWRMQICPNGSTPKRKGIFNWYFMMISLPPKIAKVSLFYRIVLLENDTSDDDLIEMHSKATLWGWGQKKLKFEQMKHLLQSQKEKQQMTFAFEVKIVDIFDANGDRMETTVAAHVSDKRSKELEEFVWCIEDGITMNAIKRHKTSECVTSKIVKLCGFDWFLSFYACGKTEKEKYESKLYINLNELPQGIDGISFYYEMYIKETKSSFNNYAHFRTDYLARSWETTRIKITDIQKLNKITFTLKLRVVDIYSESE